MKKWAVFIIVGFILFVLFSKKLIADSTSRDIHIIILSANHQDRETYELHQKCSDSKTVVEVLSDYYTTRSFERNCCVRAQIQGSDSPPRSTQWETLGNNNDVYHLIENGFNSSTIGSTVSVTFEIMRSPKFADIEPMCRVYLDEKSHILEAEGNKCADQFPYDPKDWEKEIYMRRVDLEIDSRKEFIYKCLGKDGCNLNNAVRPLRVQTECCILFMLMAFVHCVSFMIKN